MGSPLSRTLEGLLSRIVLDDSGYTSNPEDAKPDQYYSAGFNACIDLLIGEWDAYIAYCEALTEEQQLALEYLLGNDTVKIIFRNDKVSLWIVTEEVGGAFSYIEPIELDSIMQLYLHYGDLGVRYWISKALNLDPLPKYNTPEFISLKEKLNT